jgi:hypothetical protein
MNACRSDLKTKSIFLAFILITLTMIYIFYEDVTKTLCYSVAKISDTNNNISNKEEVKRAL